MGFEENESRSALVVSHSETETAKGATGMLRVETTARGFRSTGEVCALLGVPRHVVCYWERRFPLLKPLITSGGRRHWATNDVELLQGIRVCLLEDLLTIRGVQRLIRIRGVGFVRSVGRGEASAVIGAETLKDGSGRPAAP